jgi:asparagine synthase (glutamine-hydrolysing)
LTVVFNGEIYNHRALRRQLESLGHRFHTDHSDTEVLLHGYRAWGVDLPGKLNGMFAFAIWDRAAATLFLCRDRAGKKPLFVRRDANELRFASVVSALVVGGAAPRIDADGLDEYLRFGYTTGRTLLDGVRELPPGSWMLVPGAEPGAVTERRYWTLSEPGEGTGDLGRLLEEAVERRLDADVPLGCFLSGGIDSSLVAALAQQALRRRDAEPLQTFSVSMPEVGYDEAPYARMVAQHIGSRHTELVAHPGTEVLADLRLLTAVSGEPMGDSSILPTYWLSRATRRHVKVALSGDGGDEVFGGYERYRAMRLLRRHGPWLRRTPLARLARSEQKSLRSRIGRLAAAAGRASPAEQYLSMIELFSHEQLRDLGRQPASPPPAMEDWQPESDPVAAAMRWDFEYYLPGDVLQKVDRASMAVALEVRAPLLDFELVEASARLSPSTLMSRSRLKALLKQIAAPLLPTAILARKKQGFALPIGKWFRGPLKTELREHLTDGRLASLGLRQATIDRLFREHADRRADHTHRLFTLLSLALWLDWLHNPTPAPLTAP